MILRFSSGKDYRKRSWISFGFIFNVSQFHQRVCFGKCDNVLSISQRKSHEFI